jgi:hypothetical protein
MIQIDWQQIIAYLLIGASGLGGLAWGGKIAWAKFRTAKPKTADERSADEPAPPGAIEWVSDICEAMGDASAESKLKALTVGSTRDNARAFRITELEAKP